MRDIDGTGHHPDKVQPGEAREDVASDSRESHEILLNPPDDPAEWRIWMQGYLAACSIVAAQSQARIEEIMRRAA